MGLPQMIHKFYAIKDEKAISKATVVSTAFALLIGCGAYLVGAFGRLYLNNNVPLVNGNPNFDMIIPELLKIAMPEVMLSIILLLVLSASMSTLASIVLTSSSAIAMDLVKGYLFPNIKDNGNAVCAYYALYLLLFLHRCIQAKCYPCTDVFFMGTVAVLL